MINTTKDPYSESKTDYTVSASVYEGKIEEIDSDYKSNGLVKVRIPILHEDMPLSRIPWARLSDFLRAACLEWDEPQYFEYSGTLDSGTLFSQQEQTGLSLKISSISLDLSSVQANVQVSGSVSCDYPTPPVTVTHQGSMSVNGSGSVSGSGNLSGSSSASVSQSGMRGDVKFSLTQPKYSLWPYRRIRTGPGLIRIGDSVLVHVLNGNRAQLAVTEIYRMGG